MSGKHRRDVGREQFWRRAIAEWRKSGQSVRDYCSRRNLTESNFFAWRRELMKRDQEPQRVKPAVGFVPVRVVPDAMIEVVLTSGVTVRGPMGMDAGAVAKLVAALGNASC